MKVIVLLILNLILSSCFSGGLNDSEIEGLYINTNELNAVHLIKIKDSTYIHYYKGDLGEFKQEEKFTRYQDSDKTSVGLKGWEFYGEQTRFTKAKRVLVKGAEIKNGEILMDIEMPKLMNFHKTYNPASK